MDDSTSWSELSIFHCQLSVEQRTLPTGRVSAFDTCRVVVQPEDLAGARDLASKDKYGFQWWILPLIGAKAYGSEAGKKEGKKEADRGINGELVFTGVVAFHS